MDQLDDIVEEIRQREEARKSAAERVRTEARAAFFDGDRVVEDQFLIDVVPDDLADVAVAGVDGGLARKAFHGCDVVMVRAAASIFRYENGRLDGHRTLPETPSTPRTEFLTESMPRQGVDRFSTLLRLEQELRMAREALDDVDVLLLDGALVPQFPDKPSDGSPLADQYRSVVSQYRDLYRAAADQDVLLAGVVEDTRDSDICTVLARHGFEDDAITGARDSALLHHVLEAGERTLLMEYGGDDHPILNDLGADGDNIYSTYVKTVKKDRPVRVDVYAPEDPTAVADAVAAVLAPISGVNDAYGIPAPLIEADQRAKLEGHEVETVTGRIRSKLAHLPALEELRRERRPF